MIFKDDLQNERDSEQYENIIIIAPDGKVVTASGIDSNGKVKVEQMLMKKVFGIVMIQHQIRMDHKGPVECFFKEN